MLPARKVNGKSPEFAPSRNFEFRSNPSSADPSYWMKYPKQPSVNHCIIAHSKEEIQKNLSISSAGRQLFCRFSFRSYGLIPLFFSTLIRCQIQKSNTYNEYILTESEVKSIVKPFTTKQKPFWVRKDPDQQFHIFKAFHDTLRISCSTIRDLTTDK